MIRAGAVATLVALALTAGAGPARADDDGFIGRPRLRLEIDDCPPHPDLPKAELAARANEYYERAEVLYVQGDYPGAITEFVAAHCLIPAPTVLKDIAQAYERSVRYDMAIAYLERFVVDTDDPTALKNAASRVQVLSRLSSTIRVATVPPRAQITVRDGASVRGMAVANTDDVIALPTGRYTMTVELPNYEPIEEELTIGVGQPYSYSYRLEPRRGRLRVQTVPGDARILVDDLFVGAGLFDGEVDLGPHTIDVDQPGWIPAHQTIEVKEQATADASIALTRPPSTARWLAIGGTTAFGAYIGSSVGAIIAGDNAAAGAGLGGLVAGGVAGYVLVPEDIRQGTASLLLTATSAGIIGGLELGTALSDDSRLVTSTTLAGSVVGATAAVLVVRQTDVSDGQAALVNSGLLWGTISGLLFTQVFIGSERTDVALTAAGSNLGLLTGIVLARRYDVSRRRSIYIDLAGAAGLVAGLAVQNGVQSSGTGSNSDESRSHFTLGGMAIGLGLGIYLTRNFDAPRLRIQPQLVPVRDAAGGRGAVLGFVGTL